MNEHKSVEKCSFIYERVDFVWASKCLILPLPQLMFFYGRQRLRRFYSYAHTLCNLVAHTRFLQFCWCHWIHVIPSNIVGENSINFQVVRMKRTQIKALYVESSYSSIRAHSVGRCASPIKRCGFCFQAIQLLTLVCWCGYHKILVYFLG